MATELQQVALPSIRLLILGAGAVVSEYYVPALRMVGWQRDAVIVDPAGGPLSGLRKACPEATPRQLDFRAALDQPDILRRVDAAVVALPNSLHEDASQLALERGLHVLCEKPLATTREACCRLAQAADRANRILAVGMVRRLLPSFSILREVLRQGLIGQLAAIDIEDGEPYAWTSDSGAFFQPQNGGVLADMGVHYLDLVQQIAGELTPICYSHDSRGGVEANLVFELQAPHGLPVRLALSRTRTLRNTFVCRGERGELIVEKDVFDRCTWRSFDTDTLTSLLPTPDGAATLQACFARQLIDFGTCIARGSAPMVSAERAASTVGLIEWAYRGRASHRAVAHERATPAAAPLPSGPVFVTGATGFIGSHLIERLVESSNNPIVAAVRNYRTCAEIARFPLQMPRVDLTDYAAVRSALSDARLVFHLAYGRDGPQAERVTVQGTRNVVEAAIAAGCEAVVVLSTVYVFGRPNAQVDETWPYRPVGGTYGTSKAVMDRWCLSRAQSSPNTRIVLLNPACVYGPRGQTYTALPVQMARHGAFCWIERGRGAANYTFVGNLVDAMLLAATTEHAHGQRFIISDGHTTWRMFLGDLLGVQAEGLPSYTPAQLRRLHAQRPRPSVLDVARLVVENRDVRSAVRETRVGELALRAAERVAPVMLDGLRRAPRPTTAAAAPPNLPTTLPPEWLADLFSPAPTVYDARKARQELGWTPRVSLEAGMRVTREWLDSTFVA